MNKILFLGANQESISLVVTAKKMGLYTIVTDYNKSSPAKQYSDKSYDVDASDIGNILRIIREEKVNAILPGVADALIEPYAEICKKLSLPCYLTKDASKYFTNKIYFKQLCKKFNIKGVPEYPVEYNSENKPAIKDNPYPVIVKPADSSAGKGITVCKSQHYLSNAIARAKSFSKTKQVIVERLMQCDDMGIYLTIKNSEAYSTCIYDRFTCKSDSSTNKVCTGGIYPSKYIQTYLDQLHNRIVEMIRSFSELNGYLMISAFLEDGDFYVYDVGYRLQGEAPQIITKSIFNTCQEEILIDFAVHGIQYSEILENNNIAYLSGKYAATIWILVRPGHIKKIIGLDLIERYPSVICVSQRLNENDIVKEEWNQTERQVAVRIYAQCNHPSELEKTITYIEANVKITNLEGESMILETLNNLKRRATTYV